MILADLLWRNQGNTLTPELIVGLLHGAEYVDRLSTASVPLPIPGDWEAAPNLRESPKRLVLDEHGRVAEWVAQQTGCSAAAWAGYVCLGLENEAGELLAGIVLESYNGNNANVHIAGVGRNWMNRNMLRTFFHYCFNHLKLRRLTGLTPAHNTVALAFNKHVGFEVEYTMPDGAADGDLVIQVLRPENCHYVPKEV
jgi:RimJ/RimL family protein N-acetyltransferase